jgi:hypothetical protein
MTRVIVHGQRQHARPGQHQHAHDLFGGVRRGRDVVGGEHRQASEDVKSLVWLFRGGQRAADEHPAEALEGAAERRRWLTRPLPGHQMTAPDAGEAAVCGDAYEAIAGLGALDGLAPLEIRMGHGDRARSHLTSRCAIV